MLSGNHPAWIRAGVGRSRFKRTKTFIVSTQHTHSIHSFYSFFPFIPRDARPKMKESMLFLQQQQQQKQEQAMDTLYVLRMQEAQTYQSVLVGLPSSLSPWYYDKKLMEWFKTMTQWCVTVTECCSMHMETVEIAINLLDRYYHSYHCICLCRRQQQQEQAKEQEQEVKEEEEEHQVSSLHFQLATMTCLYIASKISASRSLTPKQLERLGRNQVSTNDIEAMERSILETLKWNINPPTTFAFVKSMLDLVNLSKQEEEKVWKLVETQTKFATTQLYWLHAPVSKIALASLLNALEWAQIKISLHTRNQLHEAVGISTATTVSATTTPPTTGCLIGQFQQSLAASVHMDAWLEQQMQEQQQVPPTKQMQPSSSKNNNKTTSTIASVHGESSPTTTVIS
jgi:hypothetical protein